jgi:hypothetical protein
MYLRISSRHSDGPNRMATAPVKTLDHTQLWLENPVLSRSRRLDAVAPQMAWTRGPVCFEAVWIIEPLWASRIASVSFEQLLDMAN